VDAFSVKIKNPPTEAGGFFEREDELGVLADAAEGYEAGQSQAHQQGAGGFRNHVKCGGGGVGQVGGIACPGLNANGVIGVAYNSGRTGPRIILNIKIIFECVSACRKA
jgi:hypothetical protein